MLEAAGRTFTKADILQALAQETAPASGLPLVGYGDLTTSASIASVLSKAVGVAR